MSGEEMLHCPYNYSHVILKSRMASHLRKCRLHFPLENYTTCPFNATHDVPAPELKYHADTCPDRKTMENYLYVIDDEKEDEELNLLDDQTLSLEENWDDEKVTGSYLEAKEKTKEDAVLLKAPIGKSKSEKRAFCQSQVQKFQNDQRKLSIGKNLTGSRLVTHVFEEESTPTNEIFDLAHSSHEEQEFIEVVKKPKKSGVSRGSILREAYISKDNLN